MDTDRRPAVPIPFTCLWREFRIRVLPLLVILGTIVSTLWFWRQASPTATLSGQAEGPVATISSSKAGVLTQLQKTCLEPVHQGEVLAEVLTTDPEVVQAAVGVIRAEIQSLRASLEPLLPHERLAVSFDRLRLACLEQRVELAASRAKLGLAESEWRRAQELFRSGILSQQALEQTKTAHERLAEEVQERSKLLAEQEATLAAPRPEPMALNPARRDEHHPAVEAAIHVQEAKLRLTEAEMRPVILRAPIDGVVSAVHRRPGESLATGEPVVTITGTNPEHIVSYLRPPLRTRLAVGMAVEIRSRGFGGSIGHGKVLRVGSRMEPIIASLRWPGSTGTSDLGLPVHVSLPCEAKLFPGEIVDLSLMPSPGRSTRSVAAR